MTNNKYIIKNLAPWMIDELIAFSKAANFEIIFLRTQKEFYQDDIDRLKENNIKIFVKPTALGNIFKKLLIVIKFVIFNISKFRFRYNFVLGFKSVIWFLKLDLSKFSSNSNMHAQFATQGAIISLLIKKYFNNKPSFSFTFHAHDIYFNNRWFNLLLDNCQNSFSISNYNIKYVNNKYTKSDKIKLARLGVFTDLYKQNFSKEDRSEDYLSIGLISWFVEKKGISFLLEAMNELKANNIRLLLAGDGPLKNTFTKYIKENNLEENVHYIGKVKGDGKFDFFSKLDVFILPSITLNKDKDGIPVVLMEAIANGIPLISTDVSGIPEICINDYNGFLIKEKSVDAIIKSVIEISKSKRKRLDFSKNALKLSQQYDIQINSDKKLNELHWL